MSNKTIRTSAVIFPILIAFFLFFSSLIKPPIPISPVNYTESIDSLKISAFNILENKCNACHRISKHDVVFTKKNMDSYATSIYKQVFKKRKMPKGKANKLTDKESEILKKWLNSIL